MTDLETYMVRRVVHLRRILRSLGQRCWDTIRVVLDEIRHVQRALKFYRYSFEFC